MTPAELLRAAREKVARGWTQGAFARDESGKQVSYVSLLACAWCSVGAIEWAGRAAEHESAMLAFGALREVLKQEHLVDWNDAPGRTQAEVLAAFDRAIALVEGASQ